MPSGKEIQVVTKMLVQSLKKAVKRSIWWVPEEETEEEWTQLVTSQMAQLQAEVETDADFRRRPPVVEKFEASMIQMYQSLQFFVH